MIAGDDQRHDTCRLQLVELLHHILMAHRLAVFRQVARDQYQLRLDGLDTFNRLVEQRLTEVKQLAVSSQQILPSLTVVHQQARCRQMEIRQHNDLGLRHNGLRQHQP